MSFRRQRGNRTESAEARSPALQPSNRVNVAFLRIGGVVPAAAFSLQSVTERFRRLPCLFIAMGIADCRADILVAEQFLDFPQILSHLVEQDRGRGVAQPMRGDLPYPEGSTGEHFKTGAGK
jgi:hypothetical protein